MLRSLTRCAFLPPQKTYVTRPSGIQHIRVLREIWGYVAIAFNKVDDDRLRKVGPDRMCAEWLLKNGGGVRIVGMPGRLLLDYNSLPAESVKFKVKEVDASNASIMKIGLEHFRNCHYIDTVIFHNCKHLENDSLEGLLLLRDTLRKLQVSGCYNINDSGLRVIKELDNLREFKIFDMPYVKNIDTIVTEMRTVLPNCNVFKTEL